MILDFNKPLHESEEERYKKYGPIYGYYEGTKPVLSVAEPELLRDILLKDFSAFNNKRELFYDPIHRKILPLLEGDEWKRIRSILSPSFTTGKIKTMFSTFEDCADILCKNFTVAAKEGKNIDAKKLFGAFTMDVIASSAFSTKLDSHNDPNNKFIEMAKAFFTRGMDWKLLLANVIPSVATVINVDAIPSHVTKFFRKLTLDIVEERKKTGKKVNDFLQLIIDAHKGTEGENKTQNGEIDANYLNKRGQQIISSNGKNGTFNNELMAQCIDFFLTGYNSSSTCLSLTAYLLASHPEIQEKLIEEIDTKLRENEGKLTYDAIQSMKYLDNVISESLRIYPPEFTTDRVASRDYTLGKTGITISKGTTVVVPIYAIHRDPKYYPNPEKFDPDRFSNEERAKRPAYAYIPFGGGPRICVAMRFAMMEIKTCLACVFSRFRMKVSPEMKLPLEFNFSPFVMHLGKILLEMEVRNDV